MSKPTSSALAGILESAGREILMPAFLQQNKASTDKDDGSVVTETDLACQQHVRQKLAAAWPDIAFLGEEMEAAEQHACLQQGGRLWCLDPLDGTTNFVTSFPGFALSLALIEDGSPVLACIVDPVRNETFCAQSGHGAQLNGSALHARPATDMKSSVGFVDFKRLDATHRLQMTTPGHYRSQRNIGSCALEWAWLAAGRGQFIIHGGEKIWDFSAGGLIALEAGCTISDFDGKALFDNIRPVSSIAAAASDALHQNLLQLLNY
ncbi:MAG: inositol monophosphatase [Zetaproteobacteria bacterium CG06_land_8_20_14_3_00_59_53]|nr:MAG: inositol monophosphatase [Zetaproteobacteria bacterium CG2_30_59_37]PIO89363.1 MAG: inositol monophosphatase [Zetaproteobacteria bacterium CG23_combo_of_CG06-09_8_20_14_all_59_86]PIQ65644.1 MAG: inositol monophosphatase [Zetaproteobacteria bacterium CG11_big_fil_rev_8_21_14_0_20_59_439]PIU70661.1 MAG: inositol monophosphatase [Zetaproteobacteria bacterium CG06_land_8_20_14_3_00_59_53]PIU98070.1 MAG: inositol monophosphatase [Zetaproteobacteria bacterium CG03_land_8_20_14_0_80_59_51]PIY